MNKDEFDKKYKDKGGIYELTKMRASLATLKQIADKFGVSRERIRQWMFELFGDKYDPRNSRKEDLIVHIIECIKGFGVTETSRRYKSGKYIEEALERIKNEK